MDFQGTSFPFNSCSEVLFLLLCPSILLETDSLSHNSNLDFPTSLALDSSLPNANSIYSTFFSLFINVCSPIVSLPIFFNSNLTTDFPLISSLTT
jgi:hypothetical protein